MNVKGLTDVQAAKLVNQKSKSPQTGKSTKSLAGESVSLSSVDRNKALRIVADKSLQQIAEMTRFAAQALGYDPDTLGSLDVSPEATSSRIADFAIGLFGLYKQQNPDMSEQEALDSYEELINGAVNKGYREALSTLSGLGVNDRGILDTAQKTIEMTFQKLNDFFTAKREVLAAQQSAEQTATQPTETEAG